MRFRTSTTCCLRPKAKMHTPYTFCLFCFCLLRDWTEKALSTVLTTLIPITLDYITCKQNHVIHFCKREKAYHTVRTQTKNEEICVGNTTLLLASLFVQWAQNLLLPWQHTAFYLSPDWGPNIHYYLKNWVGQSIFFLDNNKKFEQSTAGFFCLLDDVVIPKSFPQLPGLNILYDLLCYNCQQTWVQSEKKGHYREYIINQLHDIIHTHTVLPSVLRGFSFAVACHGCDFTTGVFFFFFL